MPRPDKSLYWLGKYLSLALVLPASVMAGYIVGAVLDDWLRLPILRVAGIALGMVAGLLQIFRELDRDAKREASRR
jgi:F0F1-type ATP synthase assembly protein I